MKQKVEISVSFNGNKNSQSKALQIAAGFSGVDSAAFEGKEDKTQIVVTGANIDMIELVKKLKKKVGFSKILTVTLIDGDKKDKDEDEDEDEQKVWQNCHVSVPPYYLYQVPPSPYPSNNCTIF